MLKVLVLLTAFLTVASALADEVSVTVYNSDLGVVSESRTVSFEKGINQIAFRDVPARIDPASVRIDVTGKVVTVLEQPRSLLG